jgi:hypothetical protein
MVYELTLVALISIGIEQVKRGGFDMELQLRSGAYVNFGKWTQHSNVIGSKK